MFYLGQTFFGQYWPGVVSSAAPAPVPVGGTPYRAPVRVVYPGYSPARLAAAGAGIVFFSAAPAEASLALSARGAATLATTAPAAPAAVVPLLPDEAIFALLLGT